MKSVFWLLLFAIAAAAAWLLRHSLRKWEARKRAQEAGEPALAIQLYGRLLARYPATTLASPARAAVEAQKKKLLKV